MKSYPNVTPSLKYMSTEELVRQPGMALMYERGLLERPKYEMINIYDAGRYAVIAGQTAIVNRLVKHFGNYEIESVWLHPMQIGTIRPDIA